MNKLITHILLIIALILGIILVSWNILYSKTLISGLIFIMYLGTSIILIRYSARDLKIDSYIKDETIKRTQPMEMSKENLRTKIAHLKEEEKSLEKELSQMEEWYDATVKRELKMIELKKKIKSEDK
jgi:amino acid permease